MLLWDAPVPAPPSVAPGSQYVFVAAAADPGWLDYLSAVSSLVAALGAIGALYVAAKVAIKELARHHLDAEDRRRRDERGQAEAVTAWAVPRVDREAEGGNPMRNGSVRNASDQAVYDVTIPWRSGPPTVVGVLPPQSTRFINGPGALLSAAAFPVRFRDAAGRWWLRTAEGELSREGQMS